MPFTKKGSKDDVMIDSFDKLQGPVTPASMKYVACKPENQVNKAPTPFVHENRLLHTSARKRNFSHYSEQRKSSNLETPNKASSSEWLNQSGGAEQSHRLKKAKTSVDKTGKQQLSLNSFLKKVP